MRRRRPLNAAFALALASALALACGEPREEPAREAAAATWTVGLRAAGPIAYGATLEEASRATGDVLVDPSGGTGCELVTPPSAPPALSVMVENGLVVRVDVDSAGVATDRGAQVGMHEPEIRRLYPEGLVVRPHKYDEGGRYLVVVPRAAADSAYRIVFEVDGQGRVLRYRAGILPAVEYVEGCA